MALNPEVISCGVFSLIYVIVTLILSLRIVFKYRILRKKTYLFVGLAWIGMSRIFLASSISFLSLLIIGKGLPLLPYILITYPFQSVFLILWLLGLSDLMDLSRFKKFICIYFVIIFFFEAIMFYYYITDISVIAVFVNPVDITLGLYTITYLLLILGLILLSGIVLAIEFFTKGNTETKLKGKFLLLAFALFVIGTFLETFISFPPIRLLLAFSAITFYIGFMMPESIKKRFLKDIVLD